MAYATSTNGLKDLIVANFIAAAEAGATAVFGSGGHDVSGDPIAVDPTQTALHNQLIANPISASDIGEDEDGNVQITGRLSESDLVGSTISEFGIKIGTTLVGVRNSAPKVKESDEAFETSITFIF